MTLWEHWLWYMYWRSNFFTYCLPFLRSLSIMFWILNANGLNIPKSPVPTPRNKFNMNEYILGSFWICLLHWLFSTLTLKQSKRISKTKNPPTPRLKKNNKLDLQTFYNKHISRNISFTVQKTNWPLKVKYFAHKCNQQYYFNVAAK